MSGMLYALPASRASFSGSVSRAFRPFRKVAGPRVLRYVSTSALHVQARLFDEASHIQKRAAFQS